jgi:peptidoglycan/xylan/chitin deacetylase (PgdA/CDA1 family)
MRSEGERKLKSYGFIALAISAALLALASCTNLTPQTRTVAITFDDLPMANANREQDPLAAATLANSQIIDTLRRYRAPGIGFVNEAIIQELGPDSPRLLIDWNRGRNELANHGHSHLDANNIDLPALEREVVKGEATIAPMARNAGRSIRFFRFPYNHLGDTAEKQAGILAFLKSRGYQLAASTIDTSDYVFDAAYARARLAQDVPMQERIKEAYLDYTEKQIAYYARLNNQVLGYEPPAIMLLHVNRINADTLDGQLALFRKAGYRFVTLAQAQSDPAYAAPPRNHTRFGPMWGYRWARDRGVRVDGRLEEEPPAWVSDYGAGRSTGN